MRENEAETRILIVDDQRVNLDILTAALKDTRYNILTAPSAEIALKIAPRAKPDLILLDIVMPGTDGFSVCCQLKQNPLTADIPIIFVTAKDETRDIIKGFHLGGVDYITKPFASEEVLARVETHLKINRLAKTLSRQNSELERKTTELTKAIEQLRGEIARREQAEQVRDLAVDERQTATEQLSLISQREAQHWGIDGFVGKSKTVGAILGDIRRLHQAEQTSVLIHGESGTGKELIARAIHFGSPRANAPFIPVNCSAIPLELAESLFFGHVKGAFTGANTDKKGYFELASGGTLFLDEIGDMPHQLQAKLLRTLEDGCITPVGGTREKQVDVRILSATNADLSTKIAEKTFRDDLYYRLAAFTVEVPPLRERQEDIPLLGSHFLSLFATEMGREKPSLSDDALSALAAYPFPGNIRELKNVIERALIESEGATIEAEHLHFLKPSTTTPSPPVLPERIGQAVPDEYGYVSVPLNLEQAEIRLVKHAVAQAKGNIAQAARLLGANRVKVYKRLAQDVDPSVSEQ